jgi:hypothetical protein
MTAKPDCKNNGQSALFVPVSFIEKSPVTSVPPHASEAADNVSVMLQRCERVVTECKKRRAGKEIAVSTNAENEIPFAPWSANGTALAELKI